MTIFKQSENCGYAITVDRFKCKKCIQMVNMVKLTTNITPNRDHIRFSESINSPLDAVEFKHEYTTSDDYYDNEDSEEPILLGTYYKDEQTYYQWHFVHCPECNGKHILQYKYDSEIQEDTIDCFPLFDPKLWH